MDWTYEKRQGILHFLAVSCATAISLKLSMHETNHSSHSNAEVKNGHIYILILPKTLCCGSRLCTEILTIFTFDTREKIVKVRYNLGD